MKVTLNYKITEELARGLAFDECPVETGRVLEFDTNDYNEINKLLSLGAVMNTEEGVIETITLHSPWLYAKDGNGRKWKEREVPYLIDEESVPFFLERLDADIAASNRYVEAIERFKSIAGDSMYGLITHAIADERISEEDLIVLVGIADKISAMHHDFLEKTFKLRGFKEDSLRAMARREIIASLDVEAARKTVDSYPQWREEYILFLEEKLHSSKAKEAQEQQCSGEISPFEAVWDEIIPDNGENTKNMKVVITACIYI